MRKILKTPKITNIVLCYLLIFFIGNSTIANATTNSIINVKGDETINQLLQLNDPSWNEFLSNTDLNSPKAISNEIYVKVYEDETGITMENKTYTLDEYLIEKSKPEPKGTIIATKWLKFVYQIYPVYNNITKASVIAGYEWLSTPEFQLEDIFTVSTDTNAVIPGANGNVNASFWPNIGSAPGIAVTYNNKNSLNKYQFDTNGVSFKNSITAYQNDNLYNAIVNGIPNAIEREKYFTKTLDFDYRTKGCPKGILGFMIDAPTTNPNVSKLVFTYHHRQVTANFNPSISISSSGSVSIGGFTGGLGYDKASTSISYKWGSVDD